MPAQDGGQDVAGGVVEHIGDIGSGHLVQHQGADVVLVAHAAAADGDLAGVLVGVGDQVVQALEGPGSGTDGLVLIGQHGDLGDVVPLVLAVVGNGAGQLAGCICADGGVVSLLAVDIGRAHQSAASGEVLDHDVGIHIPAVRHDVGQGPGIDVRPAAGAVRADEVNGAAGGPGAFLRLIRRRCLPAGAAAGGCQQHQSCQNQCRSPHLPFHHNTPSFLDE